MGKSGTREPWPEGGYIRIDGNGRRTYIIEREVRGQRFHVSTRCHTAAAAYAHLRRFEADPHGYSPAGVAADAPLLLTPELAEKFTRWQRDAKEVTRKHANFTARRVAEWMVDLSGVDLRKASLRDHIIPALEKRKTMRGARIAAIKVLYTWLRTERHLLTSAEDPTLDIEVPQSLPAKRRKRKAVELARLRAVLPHLAEPYRDCLVVMAATGWHFTELSRFIRDAGSEIQHVQRESTIAVLLTRHKNREEFRTPLTEPEALAAAERLRARRRVPKQPNEALRKACAAAGVARFTFGVMRHSVATLAAEGGATKEQIGALLQHKDARTTDRMYIDVAVPVRPVHLPTLH